MGNREMLAGYFAAVTAMDADVVRLLDRLEDPVDDAAVVVDMAVEEGTEAVDEAHRPETGL